MKAEILNIGDEILLGQIANTNAMFISRSLVKAGVVLRWITVVGDSKEEILQSLKTAFRRADVVIITGGLGPTHDDVTKYAVSEYFGSPIVFNPELYGKLIKRFEERGLKMPEVSRNQAEVPAKARILPNPLGTAPGLHFEESGKHCFVLPGVPAEMRRIVEDSIVPFFLKHTGGARSCLRYKTLRTTGIFESRLMEMLGDVREIEQFAKLAFLPHTAGVDLRLTVMSRSHEDCRQRLERAEALVRNKVNRYIFGEDDDTLEERVAALLFKQKRTIAAAESCTGGLLSHKLTNVPGSSNYFLGSVIAYSNEVKMNVLGVSSQTLEQFGAVSESTAKEMAEGVRNRLGADFGLSTTGIAGPGGGTPEKPVGLVYIGFSDGTAIAAKKFIFTNDRLANKERSSAAALDYLRRHLLKII
ncbi:nicotinamide-nucleotide amidohydrolase PncC [bacterium BMS3Abin05]|nr:nicotinamide-nucleotide amidohydrolase PncC [bacterium BMS3Abin05]GBE28526.1 nicotinamide-nucleotide amidohydrolase PncC [bacterium BMS3Bbin03]HDK36213.1 competence/damage-inducible protein A [Bacteroidota bacterium]HDZ10963.1 competence/damage-inducible protein A [Bacteroidota bacterium]